MTHPLPPPWRYWSDLYSALSDIWHSRPNFTWTSPRAGHRTHCLTYPAACLIECYLGGTVTHDPDPKDYPCRV